MKLSPGAIGHWVMPFDVVKLQSVPMNACPIGIDTCVWQLVVDCDVKYL